MTSESEFFDEVAGLTDGVFRSHAELPDHRTKHPWLTACLGSPFAGLWFVAESPSLTQVEKCSSWEQQWSISPGDKLFRRMLAKHGFKTGGAFEPGGWRCYITDVIKSAYYVEEWKQRPKDVRLMVAEAWAPVLRFELEAAKPKLVVILGKEKTQVPLDHLRMRGMIPPLPETTTIYHYSYLGSRPQGTLKPMHPKRVSAWDDEFARIASSWASARRGGAAGG